MKNNMKNKWLIAGAVATFVAFSATVQATPISGTINFDGGTATLNGPIGTATAITAFGGSTVVNNNFGVAPTGNFAGTGGTAVTYVSSGFTFSPGLSPAVISPLWTFTLGLITYSFDLKSVTSSIGVGPSLNLAGTGTVHETGFTDTFATWTFSTTGSGPTIFGFVAGNKAPDGGTTVMLLGAGLSGLALLRKKLAA
jgi:VPDSG-CTERM motif